MNKKTSIDYFIQGWSLIQEKGIKRYVIMPMLANIVIMSLLFYWLFSFIDFAIDLGLGYVPSWLQWLGYIVTIMIVIVFAILFCYLFSTITNIIAAPFNGLLAEKIEAHLTGQISPDASMLNIIKDIPRILKRELKKLFYYLLWAIPLFISYLIPVFGQTISPVLWFLFTAWMINIQYADYAFDNHKVSFQRMKELLSQDRGDNLLFGVLISFFTMVPLLNLIIMPVAVCGSTAMWVDRYRHQVYSKDNVNLFK